MILTERELVKVVVDDRTAGRTEADVPLFACLSLDFPSYVPEECPQCAAGVPIAPPRGSGKRAASAPRS